MVLDKREISGLKIQKKSRDIREICGLWPSSPKKKKKKYTYLWGNITFVDVSETWNEIFLDISDLKVV